MTELLTAAQMRAIEQAAIRSGEVTGLELMERAGQGVVEAVLEEWPELAAAPGRAVVLCGPGNNGGDGFVVARLLKARGWEVEVFLYGDPAKLPPDACTNYEQWSELGEVAVRGINSPPVTDDRFQLDEDVDLLVDALFGTGLTRPFGGLFSVLATPDASGLLADKGVRGVAVDMPTGLCSDSGKPLGPVLRADLTVSFHAEKLGHRLADGPSLCGKVVVKSIGLEAGVGPKAVALGEVVRLLDRGGLSGLDKRAGAHKYAHGHALILSGGAGHTGAARLAARGALRIGAGLVTLGVPQSAMEEVAGRITALMMVEVADFTALNAVLQDRRRNALCLGPGMGVTEHSRALVEVALAAQRAVVLDADALTLVARDATLFDALHDNCVLTPHGGEFARLFPDLAEKLADPATEGPAYSKVDAAREAAKRAGCVVLFKGADTVIATPDGGCAVNSAAYERAAPWLATAGSGDVLAGFIAGLLARGFPPSRAAETAAWLHVECARSYGPGLIAEDIPECLPQVFRTLGL